MSLEAFQPSSTVAIAATGASSDTVLPASGTSVLITNTSASLAFVRLGYAGVVATAADTPVQAGARLLLRMPQALTDIGVILASGSGVVYATVGNGSAY